MRQVEYRTRITDLAASSRVPFVAQGELVLGLILGAAVLVSRLPWVGHYFYQWDSINFALALDKFDVAAGQPQVPGYILYVWLARLTNGLLGGVKWGFVSISLISSMLAVVALLMLGKALFNRRVGMIAALLLASSPLFWFYGELALPHALDAFMVIVAAWWLYRVSLGESRWAIPAAIWLAVAGGFRPQTELFLVPLAIYSGVRLPRKHMLASIAVLVVANGLWLVPLLVLSGGVSRYLTVASAYAQSFNQSSSVLDGAGLTGLLRNLTKLVLYTAYGLSGAGLIAVVAAVVRPANWLSPRAFATRRQLVFLGLWILPSLSYYVWIHMGQQGLVFVFLPALLLVVGKVLDSSGLSLWWANGLLALAVAVNVFIFMGLPTYPLADQRVKLLTVSTIRDNDAYLGGRIEAITSHFVPDDTVIVSTDWRFVQYYLPQYAFVPFVLGGKWEPDEGQPASASDQVVSFDDLGLKVKPKGNVNVVLFEPTLDAFSRLTDPASALDLPDGEALEYFRVDPNHDLVLGPDGFGEAPQGK